MAGVTLKKLEKTFSNGLLAVQGINLEIEDGEFMVLVGPSGCAKSTTLRMIAGLEEISSGEIYIGKKLVNDLEPLEREIAMVFQNYSLYPHMTVYENMAFGLNLLKMNKKTIDFMVKEVAEFLQLTDLLNRTPKELSGGQRQRVAIGRAIVKKPKLFLFDEPLSNLDAKLRVEMRVGITKLHQELKNQGKVATMIYVTHDQVEAMTMGDRICVMNFGKIMQVDTPINLYNHPKNKFTAAFIGSPAMNILKTEILKIDGNFFININGKNMILPKEKTKNLEFYKSRVVWFGIRPEDTYLLGNSKDDENLQAKISLIEQLGNESILYLDCGDKRIISRMSSETSIHLELNSIQSISFDMKKCHLFDFFTEETLS